MSPGATAGTVMLACFVLGYIIGAYFMRRQMIRRIKQIAGTEVVEAMRRYMKSGS